jgi:hypothetical protein
VSLWRDCLKLNRSLSLGFFFGVTAATGEMWMDLFKLEFHLLQFDISLSCFRHVYGVAFCLVLEKPVFCSF